MFKTVLVPLDGTPQAAAALPLARTLARVAHGAMVLVRVASETDVQGEPERYLQAVVKELQYEGVRDVIRHGTAARELIAAAREEHADLIVMATHGRVGLQRVLMGSVAEHVLSDSDVPVVLVRPGGKRVSHLNTLLVPTDGTAGAALALGAAIGLARASGARLVLVQAIPPIPLWANNADYGVAPAYIDPAWEDEALQTAQTYVARIVSRLEAAGVRAEGQALKGGAVDSIETVAEQTDADLIVMSTHALTGPARTLLGSTADALVRTARRPVLLVRRPSGAPDYEAADPEARLESRRIEPSLELVASSEEVETSTGGLSTRA